MVKMMLKKTSYGEVIEFKTARTVFGRPIYLTHFFYLDGLLIDTGPPHTSSEVIAAIKDLPVNRVLITHQHEDHTGNCYLIEKELGIPVLAHPETIRVIKAPPKIEIYRKIMWGNLPPAEAVPVGSTVSTGRYRIEVIHTGGHSIDHTCYYEPQNGWLFSGDLYLGENLTGFMVGENIAEHLTSLQNIIALKPKILFCGLKGRLEDAEERLARKYDCWWQIGCRVKELYTANVPRKQIISEVFGGEVLFFYFSQSNWGRRYMLDSIIENLDYFDAK
jgi:endoribonuclease LACTB2